MRASASASTASLRNVKPLRCAPPVVDRREAARRAVATAARASGRRGVAARAAAEGQGFDGGEGTGASDPGDSAVEYAAAAAIEEEEEEEEEEELTVDYLKVDTLPAPDAPARRSAAQCDE